MSKRSFPSDFTQNKRRRVQTDAKKHSLDSDEDDDHDEANDHMDMEDFEGEEKGESRQVEGIRMTAFNMKEEMEEGHFDKNGHFIWKNEKDVRDNWLDNIDWQKIDEDKYNLDPESKGLGEESGSDGEEDEHFDEIALYQQILSYMKPKENVNKTIRRLGGDLMKLSSVERLRRKKAGTLNINEDVTKITEIANSLLTKTGNMNIYQETYEEITKKIENKNKPKVVEAALDMYADDFGDKEKEQIKESKEEGGSAELMWEFKWEQDKDDIQGPFDSKQMLHWANQGYFKTGVWVRKCGEQSTFYTSNRIDFDLYV